MTLAARHGVTKTTAPRSRPFAGSIVASSATSAARYHRAMSGQRNNPLHGVTLEAIVVELSTTYGWETLAREVPIRCFQFDPSVKSSLHFLRRTPWARAKVEALYLAHLGAGA